VPTRRVGEESKQGIQEVGWGKATGVGSVVRANDEKDKAKQENKCQSLLTNMVPDTSGVVWFCVQRTEAPGIGVTSRAKHSD
jgi:hypothetical protein